MKNLFLTICTLQLLFVCSVKAQKQFSIYPIGFYNQENLFDTIHDEGKKDYDFLPNGSYKWNRIKYEHKLNNMATALADMGTDFNGNKIPSGCVLIGMSEVENDNVLDDLIEQPPLKTRGYKYVHIEGPDRRGIDCAMLYNPKLFTVENVKLVPYVYTLPEDSARATRGFLTVSGKLSGEHIVVIVCHLPSRFETSFYREQGAKEVRALKDSLQKDDPNVKIMIMGDMNDDPTDKSMAKELCAQKDLKKVEKFGLYNPFYNTFVKDMQGTISYEGAWNLFDQIIMTQNMLDQKESHDYKELTFFKNEIFKRDYLIQQEGKNKGAPKRTTAGGVWLDGYSDHLPVVVYLIKEKK